jgi:hypothetical protein
LNKGLIEGLYGFFEKNEESIRKICNTVFPGLVEKLDIPVWFLFFQQTTMFTYYHEHGHILQFSGGPAMRLTEKRALIEGKDFDMTSHAMEIDADIHAAHLMTFHIIEYW